MHLEDILFTQGFGTRRTCRELILGGAVALSGAACSDPAQDVPAAGLKFSVHGQEWEFHEKAYLMLHKPAGTECSQKPGAWPSVLTLLPAPLRLRPRPGAAPGVQPVGRLDQDTTGLLLLTDDGPLIHRLNSPRRHVPKVYDVSTVDRVDARQVERLLAGVVLHDGPAPARAAACERTGERTLRLTLTEGRYHQVKRMIAAVGNQVAALHRSRVGALELPAALAPGRFRWLDAKDLLALQQTA